MTYVRIYTEDPDEPTRTRPLELPIRLRLSMLVPAQWGCTTHFPDGTHCNAVPAWEDKHYSVIAHRCGYGDDLYAYCFEHEFAHLFLAERLYAVECPIIWGLAHGTPLPEREAAVLECLAQTFQRWLRANEEPIIGGIDWHRLKRDALELLV